MARTDPYVVDWREAGPWFGLAAAVFLLNDIVFLGVAGYRAWLVVDYAGRLLALGFLMIPAAPRAAVRLALRDRPGLAALLAATAVAAAFGIAADGARVLVLAWAPGLDGWDFPPPDSRLLHAVDLLVGLSLVAATEELAFRAPLLLAARERRVARLPALAANAVLFGLIHWSQGLDNVASGALSGLAFGVSALATGSLWPALLAHYLVDLWHFA